MKTIVTFYILLMVILSCTSMEQEKDSGNNIISIVSYDLTGTSARKMDSIIYFVSKDCKIIDSLHNYNYQNGAWQKEDLLNSELINEFNLYLKSNNRNEYSDEFGIHFLLNSNSSLFDYERLSKYSDTVIYVNNKIELKFDNVMEDILIGHTNKFILDNKVKLTSAEYELDDYKLLTLRFNYSTNYFDLQKYTYNNDLLKKMEVLKYNDTNQKFDHKLYEVFFNKKCK